MSSFFPPLRWNNIYFCNLSTHWGTVQEEIFHGEISHVLQLERKRETTFLPGKILAFISITQPKMQIFWKANATLDARREAKGSARVPTFPAFQALSSAEKCESWGLQPNYYNQYKISRVWKTLLNFRELEALTINDLYLTHFKSSNRVKNLILLIYWSNTF